MYLFGEKQELVNNYINEAKLKKSSYVNEGFDMVEALSEYINSAYIERDEKYNNLANILWTQDIKHIKEVFEGEQYNGIKLLLGEIEAQNFKNIWDRATEYIYTTGYTRRSYRTNKSSTLYLQTNIDKLVEFTYLLAADFTLDKYLENNKEGYEYITIISDIIALEIDKNNQVVLDKIKEIVYSDNNTAIVTREIIKGLLKSKKHEAHIIIGELLLAAKLQEGLRQAIVESIDECSREGFIYILKIIIDNNLMRFSSVARAFCTWTGLVLDVEKPKVISKCFDAAYNCLTNEEYKNQCIASADNLLIYIGIWTIAFDEVDDIDEPINKLLSSHEKYKKLVALQFLYDTQFNIYKHKRACEVFEESDLEVLSLATKNLFGNLTSDSLRHNKKAVDDFNNLGDEFSGVKLFNKLEKILERMPKKEVEFKGSVFPWVNFSISSAEILGKMLLSLSLAYDEEVIDRLIDYKTKMDVDTRRVLVAVFLKNPKNTKQKVALIEACGDRGSWVREEAFKSIDALELNNEDYLLIENLLQYKSGDLRKGAIKLLIKQSSEELAGSVNRLISSNNENKKLAAIDIVSAIEEAVEHKNTYKQCIDLITSISDISQKEKLLIKNIVKDAKDTRNFENGFGLYDKSKNYQGRVIGKADDSNIKNKFSMSQEEFRGILNKFSSLIHEYRDYEYEIEQWDGTKVMTTLGGSNYLEPFSRNNRSLDNYPIADKVREFIKLNNFENWKLIELDFYLGMIQRIQYQKYAPWYENILENNFNFKMVKDQVKISRDIPYYEKIKTYIYLLVEEVPKEQRFQIGNSISEYMYLLIPKEKHIEHCEVSDKNYYRYSKDYIALSYPVEYWLLFMIRSFIGKEEFDKYFSIAYNYYRDSEYEASATLSIEEFGNALDFKIIDEHEVYKELMERPLSKEKIADISRIHKYDRYNLSRFTKLIEIGNKAVDTIANIEVMRGELDTEVSHLAAKVERCYGANIFIAIILASEKDTYVRGYNFVYGESTKKQMLSHLLKCCYPKEGEDVKTLRECLKDKKITDKQLIEAAMYSPQWLDIVSEYVGYEGLKSACWYFHAHVNDYFSAEKSSIVARYTPIASEDLKDGAFDSKWFIEAYNTLGEKNFKLVYDSAKYIAGGGLHKRSQLFADATLGKLDIQEVKSRVMDKRNKDYLLTYGLIPVKNKADLLERYEYIHQFIKESKKFGSQRQASEGRCGNIALLNLARNAGYSDINRLTWNMETAKVDSIRSYLQPHNIENIEIQLAIDEFGEADILCTKDDKALKSVPAKLKKHEYILKVNELKKSLKNQYVRARQSFEIAMENGEEFSAEELINLCENPVLAPMIKSLVFKVGDKFGYLNDDSLIDYNGEIYKLKKEETVIIAHPVQLYQANCWSNYQKDIFIKKLIQPFKQVFRELYLPNADELKEKTLSRRYAGHQVQPKKTVALLKTRGWVANHEEGLQKVYYNEDIIATIYAIADWFSPADIEAPTIEFVRFEGRKDYKPVPIDKIPDLIFSEVMRDVDLVVSVAHVGGVDPEASLSTVEIRTVIVDEILKLLKLSKVSLKGTHAHITGIHGEYTVHLGSGVVHKMGTGSINILPVHSSHRGRIFLPFIDSDPKSAEIISKIIFLAEDGKIKDPSVLEQITK